MVDVGLIKLDTFRAQTTFTTLGVIQFERFPRLKAKSAASVLGGPRCTVIVRSLSSGTRFSAIITQL